MADGESPFSAACLLVYADNRLINEDIFKIRITRNGFKNTLENAVFRPTAKTAEDAVPIAKARRQVAPWAANEHAPHNRFEKKPIILGRDALDRISGSEYLCADAGERMFWFEISYI